jgi:glycosyltransferase involved in cell wall biosynthesis
MQISQNMEPLVSICVPMYNAEKTIARTISSIINQKYKNIEIIIVDNCSSDTSVKIVQTFNDPRIRLIQNNTHLPCGEDNWNRCFQYTNGEFMAIFHADDVYLPDMVSRQIETFRSFPMVVGVFTQGNIINENDEIVGEFKLPPKIKGGEPDSYQKIFNSSLEFADFLPTPSAMLRRDMYLKLSPFRYDQFGSASDFDMWLRASACAPIVILDEKLMHYRVSKTQGTNVLNRLRTHESDYFRVMDFHIAQNKGTIEISAKSMNSYDLSRFGDRLFCARNSFCKKDWKNFKDQIKNIPWKKYVKILVQNPRLIFAKFQLYTYFRIFKVDQ